MNKLKLYEKFGWNYTNADKYQNSWYAQKSKYSKTSYSFKIEGLDNSEIKKQSKINFEKTLMQVSKRLKSEFSISDDIFDKKIEMVCSGSGDEIQKITALHSSSLCALLFFYNIENDHLKINIDGENVVFSKSFFEWRNPVLGNDSNIDVVLYSEKNNVVLFLESKFSEYLCGKRKLEIPYKYFENDISKEIYRKICNEGGLKSSFEKVLITRKGKKEEFFVLECAKGNNYLEGIKQMISHYLGIINFLNERSSERERYEKEVSINSRTRFYLGEILFDERLKNLKGTGGKTYLDKYNCEYKHLEKVLNADISERTEKQFKVLPEILYYSNLKAYISKYNKSAKTYYFGDE